MQFRLASIFAFVALLGTQAHAQDNSFYLKAMGGATFEPPQFWGGTYYNMDTGYNFGAAAGYYISPNFSLEADVFHTTANYTTYLNTLNTTSVMANALVHSGDAMPVDFFAGVGVGMVAMNYHNVTPYDLNELTFGGQVLAGVSVPVSDNLALIAQYRYQLAANTVNTAPKFGYNSSNVSIGLELKF